MGDSYRPSYHDPGPPSFPSDYLRESMYHFQAHSNSTSARPPRSTRAPRIHQRPLYSASERPLLTSVNRSPENMTVDRKGTGRFRDFNDLTDSDEAEMDVSNSDGNDSRPSKRQRVAVQEELSSTTRWSNPDPYTSLPPMDSTERKRKDVVKMIRKARNSSLSKADMILPQHNHDFISFDGLPSDGERSHEPPANAPTGPKGDPIKPVLGKRKRELVEEKRGKVGVLDDTILKNWRSQTHDADLPWLSESVRSTSAGVVFHEEIVDFYNWIKPQDYEASIRQIVVRDLEHALRRVVPGLLKPFGSYAAGLYLPTGDLDLVYFPHGKPLKPDKLSGLPPKPPMREFYRYQRTLYQQGIARDGSVNIIYFAKVPIIKFVERRSGLRIDLSFGNDTGLAAIPTFQEWRERYPVMPMIVAIVKHFLMIRGLNDNATGGLGGFSIICLVTSFLQHTPTSGNLQNVGLLLAEFFNLYGNLFNTRDVAIRLDPPAYLDKVSYRQYLSRQEEPDRLTIIDPNRPSNNISGGTKNIKLIFRCFSKAYERLQAALSQTPTLQTESHSILATILGTDFEQYEQQRDVLYELHNGNKRQRMSTKIVTERDTSHHLGTTNHPPTSNPAIHLPNGVNNSLSGSVDDGNSGSDDGDDDDDDGALLLSTRIKKRKATQKSRRRAERVRCLRPDLSQRIGECLSVKRAVEIGGYLDSKAMILDLDEREKQQKEKEKYDLSEHKKQQKETDR